MFQRFIAASLPKLMTKISFAKLKPLKTPLAGLGVVFLAMGLPVSAAADGTVTLEITGCILIDTGCTIASPIEELGIFSATVVYRTVDRVEEGNPPDPGFGVTYSMATVTFIADVGGTVENTMMFINFEDDCCAGGPLTDG